MIRKNLRRDCLQPVLVMKTAENCSRGHALPRRNLMAGRLWHCQRRRIRNPRTEIGVGTTPIVMAHPVGQDLPQMSFVERNDVVETLATRRTDQSLAERVGVSRRLHCLRAVYRKPFE